MVDLCRCRLDAQIVQVLIASIAAHREHVARVEFDDKFTQLTRNHMIGRVSHRRIHRQHALTDCQLERGRCTAGQIRRIRLQGGRSLALVVRRIENIFRFCFGFGIGGRARIEYDVAFGHRKWQENRIGHSSGEEWIVYFTSRLWQWLILWGTWRPQQQVRYQPIVHNLVQMFGSEIGKTSFGMSKG